MFPSKPTKSHRNVLQWDYTEETQDTELNRTNINMIKELKKFKEYMNKHLSELKDDRNKRLREAQEYTSTWLNVMTKKIQDSKSEFQKDIETLKKTQVKMMIKLKISITQL